MQSDPVIARIMQTPEVVSVRSITQQASLSMEPKSTKELPAAPLQAMPFVALLLLFPAPLPTDLEDPAFFNLDFHFLLLQPGKIHLENMGFRSLLPIHPGARKLGCFASRTGYIGKGRGVDAIKRIPSV